MSGASLMTWDGKLAWVEKLNESHDKKFAAIAVLWPYLKLFSLV